MPERYRGLVGPAMSTNVLAGQIPSTQFRDLVNGLGVDSLGIVAGVNAHARYGYAERREAADWIVAHA